MPELPEGKPATKALPRGRLDAWVRRYVKVVPGEAPEVRELRIAVERDGLVAACLFLPCWIALVVLACLHWGSAGLFIALLVSNGPLALMHRWQRNRMRRRVAHLPPEQQAEILFRVRGADRR